MRAQLLLIWALAFVLVLGQNARAQNHFDRYPTGGNGRQLDAVAPIYVYDSAGPVQFLSSTQLGAAISLPSVPKGATIAQICVETAGVRYRDDGVAPTASVGMPVVATSSAPACFQYAGPLSAIQFIAISGSPTMDISYYYAN